MPFPSVKVSSTDTKRQAIGIVYGKVIGGQAKVEMTRIELPSGIGFLDLIHTCRQVINENYRPVKEAQARELAVYQCKG